MSKVTLTTVFVYSFLSVVECLYAPLPQWYSVLYVCSPRVQHYLCSTGSFSLRTVIADSQPPPNETRHSWRQPYSHQRQKLLYRGPAKEGSAPMNAVSNQGVPYGRLRVCWVQQVRELRSNTSCDHGPFTVVQGFRRALSFFSCLSPFNSPPSRDPPSSGYRVVPSTQALARTLNTRRLM